MNVRRLACFCTASLLLAVVALVPLPSVNGTDRPGPNVPGWNGTDKERGPRPETTRVGQRIAVGPAGLDRRAERGGATPVVGPRPAAERERIREHLRGAERRLRTADVSHLTPAQRERRDRAIALLREYRRAGVFPHNHDFPGERVPYFVDRHGTLCAMAYLIAHTGGEELVERVARTANNARVPELAADPALDAWLDRHGMTVAEATRVQPMYGCCWGPAAETGPEPSYALATAGNAALAGAAVVLQLTDDGPRDGWRTVLGLASGGIGLGLSAAGYGLGSSGLDVREGNHDLAALNLGLGAAALGTVAWRLLRGDDARTPTVGDRTDAAAAPRPALSWSVRPALVGGRGAGLRVGVRF